MKPRMKRVACLLAALLLCLPLAACHQEPETEDETVAEAVTLSVPDFTVRNEKGEAVKLSDFAGEPIVLNFWASWCPPCKAEMPDFQAAYETYGREVRFVIVNLTDGQTETVTTATDYARGQGYTFPLYFDTAYAAANAYQVSSIPCTYFIGADGKQKAFKKGMLTAEELEAGIGKIK